MPTLLAQVEEASLEYHRVVSEADVARSRLYAAVVAAAREEIPLSRIARAAGLSRERVRQIVEAGQKEGPRG